MDRWAWEQLDPWMEIRRELPRGAVLCVLHGPTAGRRASSCTTRLPRPVCGAASRRISSATPMR
jgi:hypothetical protein